MNLMELYETKNIHMCQAKITKGGSDMKAQPMNMFENLSVFLHRKIVK